MWLRRLCRIAEHGFVRFARARAPKHTQVVMMIREILDARIRPSVQARGGSGGIQSDRATREGGGEGGGGGRGGEAHGGREAGRQRGREGGRTVIDRSR